MSSKTTESLRLYEKVKKGGDVGKVKEFLDGFIFGEAWKVLQRLASSEPDHVRLLELHAEAKVLVGILAELGAAEYVAKEAEQQFKKSLTQ